MRAVDIIRAVRDGEKVDPQALGQFMTEIARGTVPDYQASAFLMAVFHKGLSLDLTVAMTLAMRDSGRVIQHGDVSATKVDKHSTGGVGDKISIALAPLVAACGVPVPMVSGRGLGHTGGTLDKLESIPGFRVDLSGERFVEMVRELGISLIGQTEDLAPADRKLYALRDVTATVESIPLITASILSKKLAEGIDALVLDVKVGRGAFMKTLDDARALAKSLVDVGAGAGVHMSALLTRMEAPLGRTIGNALETLEAIEILKGEGPEDTTELTLALGAEMLVLGGQAQDQEEGRAKMKGAVDSGAGLECFAKVIDAQGGNPKVVEDLSLLPRAPHTHDVPAPRQGYVSSLDAYKLGVAAMKLGAGRETAEDAVDPAVGLEILAPVGTSVTSGQPLIRIHHRGEWEKAQADVLEAVSLEDSPPEQGPLVIERLSRRAQVS